MFESITSHKRLANFLEAPFSIGHICECMFFYNRVNLVCSQTELAELIRRTYIEDLLKVLERGRLKLYITRESYGTPPLQPGRFGYMMVEKFGDGESVESVVYRAARDVYRNSIKAMEKKELLMPFIQEYRYDVDLIDQFVTYEDFATGVLRTVIKIVAPSHPIPLDLSFKLHQAKRLDHDVREHVLKNVYEIETNFELSKFDNFLKEKDPSYTLGFIPQFTLNIVGSVLDLGLAAKFDSELSAETTNSKILQSAINSISQYERDGQTEIVSFQEHVLAPFPSISAVIDSGKRSFSDYIKLDEKGVMFRKWLEGKDFELGIVNEYINANEIRKFSDYEEMSRIKYIYTKIATTFLSSTSTLIDSPEMEAAGGLIGGYGIKKSVEWLANKLNHWRPNQFINGDVKDFLKGE